MIFIPSKKKQLKSLPIETLTDAEILHLPLDGYSGQMLLLIEIGQKVKKHQLLAETKDRFACKLHAPVSGRITGIKYIDECSFLVLENDFEEETDPQEPIDPEHISREDIIAMIRDLGIEGNGGARFPTHLKYTIGDRKIKTFIINGAECEPYLNSDSAILYNEPETIIAAIGIVQKIIRAEKIVIAIERHNKALEKKILPLIRKSNLSISIQLLPNAYPQGGELQLIKSVTRMELPKGSIPANHGVIVSNVGTLWAIFNAFRYGMPQIERVITIASDNAKIKGILKVKIGTPIGHILKMVGISGDISNYTIILGGPMMGKIAKNTEIPIDKGTGGIIIIPPYQGKQFSCIQCGYCVDVCPQRLMPLKFVRFASLADKEKLEEYKVTDCIECGACAYICPSNVPLMESIIKGKKLIFNQI